MRSDVEQAAGLPAVPPARRGPEVADLPAVPPARHEPEVADLPAVPPARHEPEVADLRAVPAARHEPEVADPTNVPSRGPEPNEPVVPALSPSTPAASTDAPSGLTASIEPLRGIRRSIAANMARSWSEIPHIHALEHIDAEPLLELRRQLKESGRAAFTDVTPLTFFAAAVAATMRDHPEANASLDADAATITTHDAVNVGVAVAAPQGLVVPVLRHVERSDLASIASDIRRVVKAARAGELAATDFRGGTVTITNFGSLGGEQALPLIRPPESVIFGFGSIRRRPFVVDDAVIARHTMHVVLGADHRLLDGDMTTSMVTQLCELLTNPINLVLGS